MRHPACLPAWISIHALREEGDDVDLDKLGNYLKFLSTPSARRATAEVLAFTAELERFLSTPSARRATVISWDSRTRSEISIHALREEGDAFLR